MKILVTGASGMLGGATALALARRGDDVTVLQRRPSGLGLREVLADVADAPAVRAAVEGHQAVLHLAAKVNVAGAEVDYHLANVEGTRSVVDACRAADVERLVHVSSPSVAHAGESLVGAGADKADPAGLRSPYARTKAIAERLALAADSAALAVLAIRPHLVWGPGDPQLVARIVERGRTGRLPLIGTGAVLVDTTYVDNAVDALVAAVDHCRTDDVHGEALVVSNGEPRPIAEILAGMCRAGGAPVPRRHVPRGLATAAGAVAERIWSLRGTDDDPPLNPAVVEQLSTAHWFDQRRTREALDWRPAVTLDEGFDALARWYAAGSPPRPFSPDRPSPDRPSPDRPGPDQNCPAPSLTRGSPVPLPDALRTLLEQPSPCFVATTMPDGSPQLTQTWVDTDGEHIVINTVEGFQKIRNMQRDPRVAVAVADPADPARYVHVRGEVVGITAEGGAEHIEKLAQRYLGGPYPWFGGRDQVRLVVTIRADKIGGIR